MPSLLHNLWQRPLENLENQRSGTSVSAGTFKYGA